MKRILPLILFVVVGFAFISQKKTKVIFFGDSITELGVKKDRYVGYILKMDSMLKAEKKDDQYELTGSGISANKVYDLYLRLEDDVLSKNPDVVVITPAVVGEKSDMSNPLDGDLNRYSNIIRDLAKKNELPLVDLRKKFLDYLKDNNPENKEKDILTYDRVHMNNKGNQFLADAMWKVLKDLK